MGDVLPRDILSLNLMFKNIRYNQCSDINNNKRAKFILVSGSWLTLCLEWYVEDVWNVQIYVCPSDDRHIFRDLNMIYSIHCCDHMIYCPIL